MPHIESVLLESLDFSRLRSENLLISGIYNRDVREIARLLQGLGNEYAYPSRIVPTTLRLSLSL
jgi:hypothetical protein